jgi:predicted nucleotidyltransferase
MTIVRSWLEKHPAEAHDSRMTIEDLKRNVAAACREFGVRRLEAFGSTARESASPSSDVDLLVEFEEPEHRPAKRYFGLLHRLEDLLGCKVDLLTPGSLRNPYFKERIMKERVPVYEG